MRAIVCHQLFRAAHASAGKATMQTTKRMPSALLLAMLAALLLSACVSGPRQIPGPTQADAQLGERIAATARAQLGRPYRYGGQGPDAFDCSGLVLFSHSAHGIAVPRTTADQYRAAAPVPERRLIAGDLLFFRFEGQRKVNHVAIYLGDGRFVHAPQTGRPVELRRLDDPGYRRSLVAAGRLH